MVIMRLQIKTVCFVEGGAESLHFVTGAVNGEIALWDSLTFQSKSTSAHTAAVTCSRYSSATKTLMTGSNDKTLRVWSVAPEDEHPFQNLYVITHENAVTGCDFLGNGMFVTAAGGYWKENEDEAADPGDDAVRIWHTEYDTPQISCVFCSPQPVQCVAAHGNTIVAGTKRGLAHLLTAAIKV
eukprot:c2289_g1_i1.p1 GENE.c2289_g1_i1~~c2289_g1_i1.p1  ORF type:complete len:183 (-),score=49.61 c2289_g1_i1:44-592(-)